MAHGTYVPPDKQVRRRMSRCLRLEKYQPQSGLRPRADPRGVTLARLHAHSSRSTASSPGTGARRNCSHAASESPGRCVSFLWEAPCASLSHEGASIAEPACIKGVTEQKPQGRGRQGRRQAQRLTPHLRHLYPTWECLGLRPDSTCHSSSLPVTAYETRWLKNLGPRWSSQPQLLQAFGK